jgi:hypothetical protein
MTTSDAEWVALRADWQMAAAPPVDVAALQAKRRWLTLWSWTYLTIEISAWLLLVWLAVLQWQIGQPVVAAALVLLAGAAAAASAWARRASVPKTVPTVLGMLDLDIARARRGARFAIANYIATAATAVYAAALFVSDIGPANAAYRDPVRVLIVALVLAAYAVGTAVYHRGARDRGRRLRALRRAMVGDVTSLGGIG